MEATSFIHKNLTASPPFTSANYCQYHNFSNTQIVEEWPLLLCSARHVVMKGYVRLSPPFGYVEPPSDMENEKQGEQESWSASQWNSNQPPWAYDRPKNFILPEKHKSKKFILKNVKKKVHLHHFSLWTKFQ